MEIPSKSVTEALAAFESSANHLSDVILIDITALSNTEGCNLTVLPTIEACQSFVSTTIDTLKVALSRAYASGRQACNDQLSIHRLPSELLILIFKMVLQPWSFKSYYEHVYRLAFVCSHWRVLIDGTPSFWTMISSTFPSDVTAGIINKSGNAPLIVDTYPLFTQTGSDIIDLHTTARWHALHLSTTSDESEIILANRGLPRLTFLTQIDNRLRSRFPITNECCPLLQGFHFAAGRLSACASNFRTLRFLALRSLTKNLCPLTSLMTILHHNPLLQDVLLANVCAAGHDNVLESDVLELPYLTCFDMDDVNNLVVVPILRALRAPKLKKLHIGMGSPYGAGLVGGNKMVLAISGALSSITFRSASPTRLILYVTPARNSLWNLDTVCATCRGSNGLDYQLQIKSSILLEDFFSELLEALGPQLRREVITEIHIAEPKRSLYIVDPVHLTKDHISALSMRIDSAQVVCICPDRLWDEGGAAAICSILSTPSSSIGVFSFPQLRTLDLLIFNDEDESFIKTMLQRRYHDNVSTDMAPLSRLNLRTAQPSQTIAELDELSRLVAPGLLSTDAYSSPERPKCWGLAELEEWFSLPASHTY